MKILLLVEFSIKYDLAFTFFNFEKTSVIACVEGKITYRIEKYEIKVKCLHLLTIS